MLQSGSKMNEHIHSCGYHCDRPSCVKDQRDELVRKYIIEQKARELSDENERNEFELWYSSTHDAVDLSKRDDGWYENWDIDLHWSAWKARALLSREQEAPKLNDEKDRMVFELVAGEGNLKCKSLERSGEGYKLMWVHQAWEWWKAALLYQKQENVFNTKEFDEMVKKGTKAWKDTPNNFVDNLRGN